jgi:hypothetical protein
VFARGEAREALATQIRLDATAESVWDQILFYEEVPGRPAFPLRALLPTPIRSEGEKTRVGAIIRCAYDGGDLAKRITRVEPPHLLAFEVVAQRLGIESCVVTLGGSYRIRTCGDATDVELTTSYQTFLRPRPLWRPLEALLVGQLHGHILRGVLAAVASRNRASARASAERFTTRRVAPGAVACTVSQSHSRPCS